MMKKPSPSLNYLINNSDEVMKILRDGFESKESFLIEDGRINLDASVFLSFIGNLKEFLIGEIEKSSEEKCNDSVDAINEILLRQMH